MKKLTFILLVIGIALSSCSKKDTFDPVAQAAADDVAIKAYLSAHPTINATKDATGLYYQVITQGTGTNPNINSVITVNYTGTLLDGTQFDSNTGRGAYTTALQNVISGWQIGVPYVKAGGRILLIIPSGMGYGNSSPGAGIPANAVLVFTIDLLTVK